MPRFGWKVALNVPAIQAQLGIAHAGLGWLHGRRRFDDGACLGDTEGRRLLVEAERAVRVARAVEADASLEQARAAIAAIAPALEIVDFAQPASGLDAIVAHSMFHYGTVLGGEAPLDRAADLGADHPRVTVDGGGEQLPHAEYVPADAAESVRFCAAYLGAFGERLEAGDWILCGSYTQPQALGPGQRLEAHFGARLGRLSISVAPAASDADGPDAGDPSRHAGHT